MEATIKVSPNEFNATLINKVSSLINQEEVDIFIMVRKKKNSLSIADNAEYLDEFKRSVKEMEEGKIVSFTAEELSAYVTKNFS